MGAEGAPQPPRRGGEAGPLRFLTRTGGPEPRLVVLMGARLALALSSLGIALALDATFAEVEAPGRRGLYGTVALAFLATAVYGIVLPRIRRGARFAAINIATDIAIVSALVHFSGGADSVFAFLYVVVAIYGALLFERVGAVLTAGLGIVAYGGVLLVSRSAGAAGEGAPSATVLLTVWGVHAGATALVAGLASFLSVELRRAGEALHERTLDLRRLQRLHQRTVESLKSGLLTTDGEGFITSFNPEAARITGLGLGDVIGRSVDEVLPEVRQAANESAGGVRARTRYCNARGEDLHLGVASYVLRDDVGSPSGHVLIFQDVSEVVEMEAELRRSERLAAVGELSASIAHEIRNPLAAISGSIQLLKREAKGVGGTSQAQRLMDIVLRETDRLNVLITDFLQFARPGPPQIGAVSLRVLLADFAEIFESARPEAVEIVFEAQPDLAVAADAEQLRQILWNLAVNAFQAMPEGGRLSIRARELPTAPQGAASGRRNGSQGKSAWVEIEVRDEGVGIEAENLDQVFEPFFTTKQGGSGLGLPTVHRIVQEHGGSLRLESAVGRGTTVRIRLPRAEGAR